MKSPPTTRHHRLMCAFWAETVAATGAASVVELILDSSWFDPAPANQVCRCCKRKCKVGLLQLFCQDGRTEKIASSRSWLKQEGPRRQARSSGVRRAYRIPWSELLKKLFAIDVLARSSRTPCGAPTSVAALTQMKEAPSRLTEGGLSDPKGRLFRVSTQNRREGRLHGQMS